MLPQRPSSILLRPLKENLRQHNPNTEHQEVEYLQEQAKWRGKAQRRSEVDERIRRSLYPEQEDVQRNFEELQRVQAMRAAAQAAERAAAAAQDARRAQRTSLASTRAPLAQRPWEVEAGSLPEHAAATARRQAAADAAAVNYRMAAAAAARRAAEKAAERDAERRTTSAEEGFFNYGAASQRWIAPDRRLRHARPHSAARACSNPLAEAGDTCASMGRQQGFSAAAGPAAPAAAVPGAAAPMERVRGAAAAGRVLGGVTAPLESSASQAGSRAASPAPSERSSGASEHARTLTHRPCWEPAAPPAPCQGSGRARPAMQHPWAWGAAMR